MNKIKIQFPDGLKKIEILNAFKLKDGITKVIVYTEGIKANNQYVVELAYLEEDVNGYKFTGIEESDKKEVMDILKKKVHYHE